MGKTDYVAIDRARQKRIEGEGHREIGREREREWVRERHGDGEVERKNDFKTYPAFKAFTDI